MPMIPVVGWRVRMNYQKLNIWIQKDYFLMSFMDQILYRLAGRGWDFLVDGYLWYNQIFITFKDQENTTFNCSYSTLVFKRMSFKLYNSPSIFQHCMMLIFSDMTEDTIEFSWMTFWLLGLF